MTVITPLRAQCLSQAEQSCQLFGSFPCPQLNGVLQHGSQHEGVWRDALASCCIISLQDVWSYEDIRIQVEVFALVLQTSWGKPQHWDLKHFPLICKF